MSKEVNTIRYVRRIPREAYGHEEVEIIRSIDAETDIDLALLDTKAAVMAVLGEDVDKEIEAANEFEIPDEEGEDEASYTLSIGEEDDDEEDAGDDDDLVEETEKEEAVPVAEEPPKKKRGRPKKESAPSPVETAEVATVDESDSAPEQDEEDEEEIDVEPPKPKARVRTATTTFDTKNKAHQSLVRDVFTDILPKWKFIAKPKLKEITSQLNDAEFLDADGEVLKAFSDQAKKLLLEAQG